MRWVRDVAPAATARLGAARARFLAARARLRGRDALLHRHRPAGAFRREARVGPVVGHPGAARLRQGCPGRVGRAAWGDVGRRAHPAPQPDAGDGARPARQHADLHRLRGCRKSRPNGAWRRWGRRRGSGRRRRRRKCARKDCTRRTPARTATRSAPACASCSRTGTTKPAAKPLEGLASGTADDPAQRSEPSALDARFSALLGESPPRAAASAGAVLDGRSDRAVPRRPLPGGRTPRLRRGGHDVQGRAARPHETGGARDLRRQSVS